MLRSGSGLHDTELSAELDRVLLGLTHRNIAKMDDDYARDIARSIVGLQTSNWHSAVWRLEDENAELRKER